MFGVFCVPLCSEYSAELDVLKLLFFERCALLLLLYIHAKASGAFENALMLSINILIFIY